MIKNIQKTLFTVSMLCISFSVNAQTSSLVDLVNPLMGTDSKFSLSNGNTYPAIATPWGMNFCSLGSPEIHSPGSSYSRVSVSV
jgi:putative alpha-1,2-mannosidase